MAKFPDLATFFGAGYMEGEQPNVSGYTFEVDWQSNEEVFVHNATGIKVWADALNTAPDADPKDVIPLFHYTNFASFTNVTNPGKSATEVWASVAPDCALFGPGVYAGSKDPQDWGSRHAILCSNYLTQVEEDDSKGLSRDHKDHTLVKWLNRTDYCLPILVHKDCAYNTAVRATPQMVHGVGRNIRGARLQAGRDVWVIQLGSDAEGKIASANTSLEMLRGKRTRILERSAGARSPATLDAKVSYARTLIEKYSNDAKKLKLAAAALEDVAACRQSADGPNAPTTMRAKLLAATAFLKPGFERPDYRHVEMLLAQVITGNENWENEWRELSSKMQNVDTRTKSVDRGWRNLYFRQTWGSLADGQKILKLQGFSVMSQLRLAMSRYTEARAFSSLAKDVSDNFFKADDPLQSLLLFQHAMNIDPREYGKIVRASGKFYGTYYSGAAGLRQDHVAKSLQHLSVAIKIQEKYSGPKHPMTLNSKALYCDLLMDADNRNATEWDQIELLDQELRKHGQTDKWEDICWVMKKGTTTADVMKDLVVAYTQAFGPDHYATREAKKRLRKAESFRPRNGFLMAWGDDSYNPNTGNWDKGKPRQLCCDGHEHRWQNKGGGLGRNYRKCSHCGGEQTWWFGSGYGDTAWS